MAIAWADSRARIATDLATVAITSPITQTVKRVYATPPGVIQDMPCFIIYPPALEFSRHSALRMKRYTVRIQFFITDQDLDRATDIVDNYREAVVDMFDQDVTLNGTCTQILGPRFEPAVSLKYAEKDYVGLDFFLSVDISTAATFAP